MSETHECGFDFKHDTCVCAKCGEPFTRSTRDDCHGAVAVEPKRVAPSAETREWLKRYLEVDDDAQFFIKYRYMWKVKDVIEMLEAHHAYRTCASPAAPSCDEKDAVAAATAGEWIRARMKESGWDVGRAVQDIALGPFGDKDKLAIVLDAYHSYRTSLSPAATNCCTATEVEAARNTDKPRCPSCQALDNNGYVDASGTRMRACSRCMIQWQERPAFSIAINPERTLEERAQEAAEEIARKLIRFGGFAGYVQIMKAIILSRIGGAE